MNDPTTPADTRLKRFARNFRNMGVVNDIQLSEDQNTVRVQVRKNGVALSLIRDKGFEFDLRTCEITQDTQSGEPELILWFELHSDDEDTRDVCSEML